MFSRAGKNTIKKYRAFTQKHYDNQNSELYENAKKDVTDLRFNQDDSAVDSIAA